MNATDKTTRRTGQGSRRAIFCRSGIGRWTGRSATGKIRIVDLGENERGKKRDEKVRTHLCETKQVVLRD